MLRIIALFFTFFTCLDAVAQFVPVVRAGSRAVSIREDGQLRQSGWNIDPDIAPDVYTVFVRGRSKPVTFISDRDSIRFDVEAGKSYRFVFVVNEKDTALTEIRGIREVAAARFSNAYVRSHRGKTFVEIPEVYELVNIVFALTKTGKTEQGLVIQHTGYYREMRAWFDKFSNEPVVKTFDSLLVAYSGSYFPVKMDAYAFEFSGSGHIRQSQVYDRASWGKENQLRPYVASLDDFAQKSGFSNFYKNHQPFYNSQIVTYRDSIGVSEMQKWLTLNFPSTTYDAFKIIFSPLVGYNQSANWLADNNYKEAHAHVNFPYRDPEASRSYSREALLVRDGNIVFTELNHSFINPEGEKPQYREGILKAFANLDTWNEAGKPAGRAYNDPYSSFNEYMNWALVSLRYVDFAPTDEQEKLIALVEKRITEDRGFRKFAEFDQYLLQLYKSRPAGQTIADLYPQVVQWFVDHRQK